MWLLAASYMEAGRQLLVDHRDQESVPYLLAARQRGEERAPLRMMFWRPSGTCHSSRPARQHLTQAVEEVRRREFFRRGGAYRDTVRGKKWPAPLTKFRRLRRAISQRAHGYRNPNNLMLAPG